MSPPFDFVCEHFTAGAVGPPGQRVFYLQAGAAGELVTLRCENCLLYTSPSPRDS